MKDSPTPIFDAEAAYRNSECQIERLVTIVNHIVGGVEVCRNDENFTLDYVNDGFLQLTGYSREEVFAIGTHCGLICKEDVADFKAKIRLQLAESGTALAEYRLPRKDGTQIWVLDKSVLVKQSAEVEWVQFVTTDVTLQKEREEALRISEKRYEIAMNFSGVTMYDYNTVTHQMTLFGSDPQKYNLPTVIENSVESLIQTGYVQPESVAEYRELYRKIDAGAPTASAIITICNAQGEEGVFELLLTNVFDSFGRPTVAVGVKRDITKSFNLEREQQYSRSLSSNQLLICEADVTKDRILTYSQEWAAQYGLSKLTGFSQLKAAVLNRYIAPEFHQTLQEQLSLEHLLKVYGQGQRLLSVEYLKSSMDTEDYQWHRININIIQDPLSKDMIIRCYLANIHAEKLKELKAVEEQQYYESMVAKSMAVFTVNVTQNKLLSGYEQLPQLMNLQCAGNYTRTFNAVLEEAIHPEDQAALSTTLARVNLLEAHAEGKHERVCEYRQRYQEQYIWMRLTVHTFEDPHTGEVKAFLYEEDINEQKLRAVALLYRSEHDPLTGLYDKAATENYITAFLDSADGRSGVHALFFLDIDHFKSINDGLGHVYGDTVLCQTAEKLRDQFRDVDILGRVGGDEFIILMKHIGTEKTALNKAQELCNKVVGHFVKDSVAQTITISVGIALYEEHGKTYRELYHHADMALYASKTSGRGCCTLYHPNMTPMDLCVKKADGSY